MTVTLVTNCQQIFDVVKVPSFSFKQNTDSDAPPPLSPVSNCPNIKTLEGREKRADLDTLTECGAVFKVTQKSFDKMWRSLIEFWLTTAYLPKIRHLDKQEACATFC